MPSTTDIKLLPEQVRLESPRQVVNETWDLCLDTSDRRKEQKNPNRRALVHDFNDGLTINWANDYPGGVTINGLSNLKVGNEAEVYNLKITGAVAGDLRVDGGIRFFLRLADQGSAQTSKSTGSPTGAKDSTGGEKEITIPRGVPIVAHPAGVMADLSDVISNLSKEIADLKSQLAALKK